MEQKICIRSFLRDIGTRICGLIQSEWNLLEVIDETAPQYDMEELLQENEGNLLGEYIRRFKDCEKDSIEYQALYEGVEVLLKNKG